MQQFDQIENAVVRGVLDRILAFHRVSGPRITELHREESSGAVGRRVRRIGAEFQNLEEDPIPPQALESVYQESCESVISERKRPTVSLAPKRLLCICVHVLEEWHLGRCASW